MNIIIVFVTGDKDAVVTVPDNLSTTPTATPTSVGVAGQHVLMSTSSPPTSSSTVAMGTGASRTDEEEIGEGWVWLNHVDEKWVCPA